MIFSKQLICSKLNIISSVYNLKLKISKFELKCTKRCGQIISSTRGASRALMAAVAAEWAQKTRLTAHTALSQVFCAPFACEWRFHTHKIFWAVHQYAPWLTSVSARNQAARLTFCHEYAMQNAELSFCSGAFPLSATFADSTQVTETGTRFVLNLFRTPWSRALMRERAQARYVCRCQVTHEFQEISVYIYVWPCCGAYAFYLLFF